MPICNLLTSQVTGELQTDIFASQIIQFRLTITSNLGLIDAQYRNITANQSHRLVVQSATLSYLSIFPTISLRFAQPAGSAALSIRSQSNGVAAARLNVPTVLDQAFIVQQAVTFKVYRTFFTFDIPRVNSPFSILKYLSPKSNLNSSFRVQGNISTGSFSNIFTSFVVAPSNKFGVILEIANANNLSLVRGRLSATGSLQSQDFFLDANRIDSRLNVNSLGLNLNLGLSSSFVARFIIPATSNFILQGVAALPAANIRAKFNLDESNLFGLGGSVDAPTQLQEFARYPLPTGTSKAQPFDEISSPIFSTQTVFGMQTFVVGNGQPGSASLSASVNAVQLSQPSEYPIRSLASGTLIFLRASILDTSLLRKSIVGFDALSPNISRLGKYSQFPRSYASSVATMNSGSSTATTLALENTFNSPGQSWSFPTTPVLFLGASLVRHNRPDNTVTSPERDVSLASDFYSSQASTVKLAHSRIESTVGTYSELLAPTYSAASMRLFSPSKFQQFLQDNGTSFKVNAALIPVNEDISETAQLHASDSSISFIPIKSGVRHFYSNFNTTIVSQNMIVGAEGGLGGAENPPNEYTVLLTESTGEIIDPNILFTPGDDCVLRMTLQPYSSVPSSAYIDIPILGVSLQDSDRVVIDSGYQWFISKCLPGGEFANIHKISCIKDLKTEPNLAPSVNTKKVLAFSSPQILVQDQGQSSERILSFAGDRNLLMGQFSMAISRQETAEVGVKINTESSDFELLGADALSVSSFDVNSLHMFVKEDGTLAGRRVVPTSYGSQVSTDILPVLPRSLREYVSGGGKVSKVKLGESIHAVLTAPIPTSGTTGKRLYIWGHNTFGHLTVPSNVDSSFLSNGYIDNVKDFDFNVAHIAIIKDDGSLKSWGCNNQSGTVWYNRPDCSTDTPLPIINFAIGNDFAAAHSIKNNGESTTKVLEDFGNYYGSIPAGVTLASKSVVATVDDALIVYAGEVLACGLKHSVALKGNGTVVCWGDNTYNQCSPPSSVTDTGSNVVAVDAGDDHCIALKGDGTVVCWGRDDLNQTSVPLGLKAKQIGAGGNFCIALRTHLSADVTPNVGFVTDDEVSDTVAAWGDNSQLQCSVPKCEGLSYDPESHKYRMRFWSVSCGWDHAIGVRKDDNATKAARDHLELTRYSSDKTKFILRSSEGTTIFSDINFSTDCDNFTATPSPLLCTSWYPVSDTANPNITRGVISTMSGQQYEIKLNSDLDSQYYYSNITPPHQGRRYRLKIYYEILSAAGSTVHRMMHFIIQSTTTTNNPGHNDFQDLIISRKFWNSNSNVWPPAPDGEEDSAIFGVVTDNALYPHNIKTNVIQRIWLSEEDMPSWQVGYLGAQGTEMVTYKYTFGSNGEYLGCEFDAVDYDLATTNLDKSYIVWGNPLGYSASSNPLDYQTYYPELPWSPSNNKEAATLVTELSIKLEDDVESTIPTISQSMSKIFGAPSYMGYGAQLGASLYHRQSVFFFDTYRVLREDLLKDIYLGPTSIRISPKINNRRIQVKIRSIYPEGRTLYGIPSIVTSSGAFFNVPTPIREGDLNLYATSDVTLLEENSYFTQVFGFSKSAAYCERFLGDLPSGFQIVTNGDELIPEGTKESLSGHHLLWTGTIPGVGSKTLVFTGATLYNPTEPSTPDSPILDLILLPFETIENLEEYAPEGIAALEPILDPAWYSTIGVDIRNVEIIKHQVGRRSTTSNYGLAYSFPHPAIAAKHITHLPEYKNQDSIPEEFRLRYNQYGLLPKSGSLERTSLHSFKALYQFKRRDLIVDGNTYQFREVYFGYRSAFGLKDIGFCVKSTTDSNMVVGSVTSHTGGDLRLNSYIPLFGPFPYNSFLIAKGLCTTPLGKSWMMDLGQATVPNAASGYGFKSVACAQFHTVAIDDQDSVLAWGSNNEIKPTGTNRQEWNPYEFSGTGCSEGQIDHFVTGYFRDFEDLYATNTLEQPSMVDDRSMSMFPANATLDKAQLVNGYFEYPDAPVLGAHKDCRGNFPTGAVLFFNADGFTLNNEQILPLLQQVNPSVSSSFKMSISRQDPHGYRIAVGSSNDTNVKYSTFFSSPPRLIYVGMENQGSDYAPDDISETPGITFSIKVDGEYIPWHSVSDAENQYISDLVPSLRYDKFMHYFGRVQNNSSIFALNSINRMFMPNSTTPVTKFMAGDSYFFALYKDAAEDKNKVRGSLVSIDSETGDFVADFGTAYEEPLQENLCNGDYGQGPFLKAIQDIVGSKSYFMAKVQRTYKKIYAVLPDDEIYNGSQPVTARYAPSGGSYFKIYLGPITDFMTGEPTNAIMDYNYNHDSSTPSNILGVNQNLRVWPKVVFPGEPQYSSDHAYAPSQITIYRDGFKVAGPINERYANNNTFTVDIYATGTSPIDASPLIENDIPCRREESAIEGSIICYDSITRRVGPQSYYPQTNLPANLLNISLGSDFSVAKTSTNKLVAWGADSNFQRTLIKTFTDNNTSVKKVVTNGEATLILKEDGTLTGAGYTPQSGILPLPPNLPLLKDIEIGGWLAVGIRSDNDQLHVWGVYNNSSVPSALGACKKVACGHDFAAAIRSSDNKLMVFGNTGEDRGNIPSGVSGSVTEVACTYSRIAARSSSSGVVYWWGGYVTSGNSGSQVQDKIGSTSQHFFVVNTTGIIVCPGIGSTQPPIVWNLDNDIPIPQSNSWVLGRGMNANHMVASNGTIVYAWGSNYRPQTQSPGPGSQLEWRGQAFIPTPDDRLAVVVTPDPDNQVFDGPYNHVAISLPYVNPQEAAVEVGRIPDSIRARNEDYSYTSAELGDLKHVISMASAEDTYFAIVSDDINGTEGSLIFWGGEIAGSALEPPEEVLSIDSLTKVTCRFAHAAVLRSNGTAYVWGSSNSGAIPVSGEISDLLDIECGDYMTVGIRSSDRKLVSYGRYDGSVSGSDTLIPEPFNEMKFSSISCGQNHVAGNLFETYVVSAPGGGLFTALVGSAVAFGQNSNGQTDIPGFNYTSDNLSTVGQVAAGGRFTALISASSGFNCLVPTSNTPSKGLMFINRDGHEDLTEGANSTLDSELIEGYMTHTSGYLCNQILPPTHSFYFNRPTSARTPQGTPYYAINCQTAYREGQSRTTNAIEIPNAYLRGGTKKAKSVAAGRFKQWEHSTGDHMFGSGYTVIVDGDTNAIEVVGGGLIPAICPDNHPTPPHTIALRTIPDELQDSVIAQIGTYRSNIYALTSLGRMVNWGYQDSAAAHSSVNYSIDTSILRKYFSLPDVSMFDYTNKAKFSDSSLIGMSYVAGIAGVFDSWAVVVALDRYFNGTKNNIRKFIATGDTRVFSIDKPVHFGETFSCVDTWPSGTATGLDTQYVLSVTPYSGVSCEINSASLFGMNLDSRFLGQKILLQPEDISNNSTAADYILRSIDNTQLSLQNTGSGAVVSASSVSENNTSILIATNNSVTYPSYLRGRFGGTARTETLLSSGNGAYVAGRIAQIVNWEPGASSTVSLPLVWYKSTSLPTISSQVTSWASGGSNSTSALASTGNPAAQKRPMSVAFNGSYKGAQFDEDVNQEDDLVTPTMSLGLSAFTYFIVYNKTVAASYNNYNLAFGKTYISSSANKVSGFGFHQGRPVLYYDQLKKTAISVSPVTGNNIACAYYGSPTYNGIRINGAEIDIESTFQSNLISSGSHPTRYNMSRPVVGFNSGSSTTYSYVDHNDIYAEILAFEGSLTEPQISIVEGYLAHKFNLQASLPSNHPYKNTAPGQDPIEVYQLPLLSDYSLLSVETNKLIEASGRPQSWVGLFDMTVSHRGQRMATPTQPEDHHAPVLAEFNIKLNQSNVIFINVSPCKFKVFASTLNIDSNTKLLEGVVRPRLNLVSATLKVTISTKLVNAKVSTNAASLSLLVGLQSFVNSVFKLSGANDCETIYGCSGVSLIPPSLFLLYRTYDPALIIGGLNVGAVNLEKTVTINYAKLSCKFTIDGKSCVCSCRVGLSGSINAAFNVQRAPLKLSGVNLGYANIHCTTHTQICLSGVQASPFLPRKYPTGGPPSTVDPNSLLN